VTPVASEGSKAPSLQSSETKSKTGQVWLSNQARDILLNSQMKLLPTLNTMEHREIKTPEQIAELKLRSPGGYRNLREEVVNEAVSWGKFEPAIRRWEAVIDRSAPLPTKPDGKDDGHRLSADFVEWLMGLPEGWVCDPEIGLKRVEQLKALGNGVVPQQAEMALRLLIDEDVLAAIYK
jgi:DNA (cytosine-5)-methyltransferase 1